MQPDNIDFDSEDRVNLVIVVSLPASSSRRRRLLLHYYKEIRLGLAARLSNRNPKQKRRGRENGTGTP